MKLFSILAITLVAWCSAPSSASAQGIQRSAGMRRQAMMAFEPSRTNLALQSQTISSATAYVSPWAANGTTVSTVASGTPNGSGVWAEVTAAGTASGAQQSPITTTATRSWTGSGWAAKASGSGYTNIVASAPGGAATGCRCGRSDGGSCTANLGVPTASFCQVDFPGITTSSVRLWMTVESATAGTSAGFYFGTGQYNVAVGTTRWWGAQAELSNFASSYVPTTASSATRSARPWR